MTEFARQLSELKEGDHVCQIYSGRPDQLTTAVAFVKEALARNGRCLYVSGNHRAEDLVSLLSASGVSVASEVTRGALNLSVRRDIETQFGSVSGDRLIDFVRDAEEKVVGSGFSSLFMAGDMAWILDPEFGCQRLIEYEALLNRLLENNRSTVLCQYDQTRFEPCTHEVFRSHPGAINDGRLSANPHYQPPSPLLDTPTSTSADFFEKRMDRWTHQLQRWLNAERERGALLERQRTLSRHLLQIQEGERRHLARELHDDFGQLLTSLRLLLRPKIGMSPDAIASRSQEAQIIIDELLEKVRGLSFDLSPAPLDQLGLLPALLCHFERYTSQTGIQVNIKHKGLEGRFAPEIETSAYRIVQEALTNVARHAGVAGVSVRVWATSEVLGVQIEDHGRGFDLDATLSAAGSMGLRSMQERTFLLGGHLTIEARPKLGTQITAELPLCKESLLGAE